MPRARFRSRNPLFIKAAQQSWSESRKSKVSKSPVLQHAYHLAQHGPYLLTLLFSVFKDRVINITQSLQFFIPGTFMRHPFNGHELRTRFHGKPSQSLFNQVLGSFCEFADTGQLLFRGVAILYSPRQQPSVEVMQSLSDEVIQSVKKSFQRTIRFYYFI